MAFNFFSNNVVYVDGESVERITSLKNTRNGLQKIFQVPPHNIDTDNLIIFKNGELQIRNVDYIDLNSNEIEFKIAVETSIDIDSILIKGNKEFEWGYF